MKVLKKQTNSSDCFICGINNELGVNARFYEMENGKLYSLFTFKPEHQSFPQRTHGGVISALLDELIGRAIWIKDPEIWGVTIELTIKYRKPVPYDEMLKGIGKIIDNDGNILAEGKATYFKLPLSKISTGDVHSEINIYIPDSITDIDE